MPLGYQPLDWGFGWHASWAVHGSVHGLVHGWCMLMWCWGVHKCCVIPSVALVHALITHHLWTSQHHITMHWPMHQPMHGPACPSTKSSISWLLTEGHQLYMILLLHIGLKVHQYLYFVVQKPFLKIHQEVSGIKQVKHGKLREKY